jgi:hypothetical protein
MKLGQIVTSVGAKALLEPGESESLLKRHCGGDYGNVSVADACVNDFAVEDGGGPILSRYRIRSGHEIVIVTEADGLTKIALPQELYDHSMPHERG